MIHFTVLPSDVIIIIMQHLSARDLAAMAQSCKLLHSLVDEFGWKIQLRLNTRPSYSLHKSFLSWNAHARVRYNILADRNWLDTHFIARPLSRKWMGKLQPVLAINTSRLFVAAGNTIYSYEFTQTAKSGDAPGIRLECSYTTSCRLQASRDITSLTSVPDGGLDRTIYIGYADGALERVLLPACKTGQQGTAIGPSFRDRCDYHGDDLVESLSSADNYLLSLSSSGTAVFLDLYSQSPVPQFIDMKSRSWSTHLCSQASTPYAAFGTSSLTPLVIHNISASEISTSPSTILATLKPNNETPRPSAVYGIAGAPPSCPWGSSDRILVSGWYDGMVRVHDMRSSVRTRTADSSIGPASLLPVMALYDPWLFEPVYDVSCGGGSSSHIAAGTARHSVVAFWDIRNPSRGWSVHAPGNDSSPVYSVILESSRLFGATQSRPFVLDFSPSIKEDTYPSLAFNHREEGLKRRDKTGIGFYVTKYDHGRTFES
ncbi:hypothetical protein AcW1_007435 [Taiwanofungus camphoratus]|nr:hypothetical protein AcW2_007505 [Antrodia cinnamomea]KAI0953131.1 hypothetical protein AcW1_007435 [Antrodia cinnamomea]